MEQREFWLSECQKCLSGKDGIQLSVAENILLEIKSLTRSFEAVNHNPDIIKLEDQRKLSLRYQTIRDKQIQLVSLIANIKDRNQNCQSVKLLMPTFQGKAANYSLFKKRISNLGTAFNSHREKNCISEKHRT